MALRAALAHPVALGFLLSSVGLAAAMLILPALQPWSARAPWLLLSGLLTYAAAVLVVHRLKPAEPPAPELRQLEKIRRLIAGHLAEQQSTNQPNHGSELADVLADAVHHINEQLEPTLRELVHRERVLGQFLVKYERGQLPMPEPALLDRFRTIHARQRAAVEQCVQQAANASATLVLILQAGDDTLIADRARGWAGDLLVLHDALEEVLHGEEPMSGGEQAPSTHENLGIASSNGVVHLEPGPSDGTAHPTDGLVHEVDQALRRLNNLAALSECALIARLPRTLSATARSAAPLEQAQVLREVLVAAVERLKPPDLALGGDGVADSLQYQILREEYILERPTRQILVRHAVSESTFHRYRRNAIEVLARDLAAHESDDGCQLVLS